MKSIWTDHLKDPEKKKDFAQYILGGRTITDRLIQIIDLEIEKMRRDELTEDYSSPSWAMLQADRLGQIKAYTKIKSLLDHKG